MKPNKMLGDLMKQAQAMQSQLMKVQEAVGDKVVSAQSGGGMVTVEVNGRGELVSIKFDPELLKPENLEMLPDLVVAAVNQGISQAKEMVNKEVGKVAGGLNIPGLF